MVATSPLSFHSGLWGRLGIVPFPRARRSSEEAGKIKSDSVLHSHLLVPFPRHPPLSLFHKRNFLSIGSNLPQSIPELPLDTRPWAFKSSSISTHRALPFPTAHSIRRGGEWALTRHHRASNAASLAHENLCCLTQGI